MKILVFDSDIQCYHIIRGIVEDYDVGCEVIGPFSTIEPCRDYLVQHKDVDIIITDVMLGGDLIFDVLNQAPDYVPVIFITAHEEYALQAFGYYSLSYIMKPLDESELIRALAKALRLRKMSPLLTPTGGWARNDEAKERIVAKTFNGEKIIHLSTVRYIVSEQKNTYIKLLDGNSYRVEKTLEEMAQQLDGDRFMRVNRKFIVPLEMVLGTERKENGKLRVLLKGPKCPDIIVSRTRKSEVCEWLRKG